MKVKGKRRSTDFPKRKNKLGKGKRPAENATKISFKSGSIVLPSQLAQNPSQQPTGKRKLGLEALLRHLNHFKPAVRSDGFTGLRELFQDNPHVLVPNLAKLVGPVFGRLIDSDPSVRHSLLTLLGTLFAQVAAHHIRPHLSSIMAHLSCGLTHISDRVQLDSIKVFRLLLDQYPSLLPPHAQHLLPLLVGLISRQQGRAVSVPSGKGAGGRKQVGLIHDPRSKLSKWSSRIDIFNLLSRFLESLLEYVTSSSLSDSGSSPAVVDLESQKVVAQSGGEFVTVKSGFCDFSGLVPCVMPLQGQGLPYKFAESLPTSDIASLPTLVTTSSTVSPYGSKSVFSNVSKFLEFSETLLSLLLECWVECAPLQSQGPKDALVLMETIVHLLYLILKLSLSVGLADAIATLTIGETTEQSTTAIDVLQEKFSSDFSKHFLASFPLPRSSPSNNQFVQYLKINLSLCHITSILLSRPGDQSSPALQNVCTYYASLSKVTSINSTSSQLMLECSRMIADTLPQLLKVVEGLSPPESYVDCVLAGVDSLYHSCHSQSSAKRCLVHCFHRLLEIFSNGSRVFTQFLLPWLESLPQQLVELGQSNHPLAAFIIDTLASAASYISLSQLEQHLVTLLGTEEVLCQLSSLSQRRFAELLWHVPTPSPRLLGVVAEWVWSTGWRVNTSVAAYLVEIVHHKLLRKTDSSVSEVDRASQYLIFMLSVLLGSGSKETYSQSECSNALISLVDGDQNMEHRMKIINVVCECVRSTYFCDEVMELTASTLQAFLGGVQHLPVDTALGFLCFLQCISSGISAEVPRYLLPPLAKLIVSVLRWAWQLGSHGGVATAWCCQVTKQLLRSSPALLVSVLELFASETEKGKSGVREITECFLSLMDSTELNLALRGCAATIHETAATISGALTDTEEDLRVRINFSVRKFPTKH